MTELRLERPIRLFAPAKVNLGLEVVGRRPDGYHEVVTLLETISLFDVLDLVPIDHAFVTNSSNIDPEADLVSRAVRAVEREFAVRVTIGVRISKSIPVSAGLGGGSSDAGTLLRAMREWFELDSGKVKGIAAELGSDVPYFLRGGLALATGTGTTIQAISTRARRWYVIVTPDVAIEGKKTASMYGALTAHDFSSGQATRVLANQIATGDHPDASLARNAFTRVSETIPEVERSIAELKRAGATFVLPSGAGPSVFTVCESFQQARVIASNLSPEVGITNVATSVGDGLNDAVLRLHRPS